MTATRSLGIGFIGAGFMNRFHVASLVGVRDCHVAGVYSPTTANAERLAGHARQLALGEPTVHRSITALVADPAVDAIWIASTNDTRVAAVDEIVAALRSGKGELVAVACEKPLARNLAEAHEMLRLVESTPLLHGYLENQVFEPSVTRGKEIIWRRAVPIAGRPYLARAAEEHSGPHMPWFWSGARQGGGVLNDMLCHSYEVARYLLTAPAEARDSLKVEAVNAQIASLKWTRREYSELLRERYAGAVDYARAPAEDFAHATITLRAPGGEKLLVEATTSWSFVGPALRLRAELLGPEYAMQVDSLNTDLSVFLSRRVAGEAGEDLVEKQNAEQGLMPVVADEAATYGYTAENRHMVRAFLERRMPDETWRDGVAVTEVLMACYKSAEDGATVRFPADLTDFVPAVARGEWRD
ncbi:MAG TPA: Gfo/Idh/MocA family oxidoreductase [Dehalococcoidia bacterium]|nr:Gfo/Idh/MocA family oxidoreductase [Dehalococcoidia bacterium]